MKLFIEQLRENDYEIELEIIKTAPDLRVINTSSFFIDHFVELVFYSALEKYYNSSEGPKIKLQKVNATQWHLVGNPLNLDKTDIVEWFPGLYRYSAKALRDHGVDVFDWITRNSHWDVYCETRPKCPKPIDKNITPLVKNKCRNSTCGLYMRCRKYDLNGELNYQLTFIPPDDVTCLQLDYDGFHPSVEDKTKGISLKYFALFAKHNKKWVGAFESKEKAGEIVEAALAYDIGGYGGLELHTFNDIPEECCLYEEPIDAVI